MDFQYFLQAVPKILETDLPAFEAHKKMAPLERVESLQKEQNAITNSKVAAVLMLCYPKDEKTHLVLIVRNSYKGVHSAQIAFPGGKYEKNDADFAATALRETFEEVGVEAEKIEIIKPFSPIYIPPSNFMVHPFLGICNENIQFKADPKEVAAIIELPIETFLSDSIVIQTPMATSYSKSILIPAFEIEKHIVWGATAMILSELKEVVKTALSQS